MKSVPSWVKGLVLFTILVIPSLSYLFLITGKNNFKHLEIFGPRDLDSKGDTIYHTIPDFSFTNQEGKTITKKDLEGKIYVANFFFATCPTICPKMSMQLQRVQTEFAAQRELKIISHTVNPEKDTVEALAAYGKKFMVNPSKWYLVTGNKKEIYDVAIKGYFLPTEDEGGGPDNFTHSEKLVLVDKEKRIRGYYDGTNQASVDTLMDEIKVLLLEYKEQQNKK